MPRGGVQNTAHQELVRFCTDYISSRGGWHYKAWGALSRAGCPDLVCCLPTPAGGRFAGIEVKTGKAILNPAQEREREAILRSGGIFLTVRRPEDLEAGLLAAGLVREAILQPVRGP